MLFLMICRIASLRAMQNESECQQNDERLDLKHPPRKAKAAVKVETEVTKEAKVEKGEKKATLASKKQKMSEKGNDVSITNFDHKFRFLFFVSVFFYRVGVLADVYSYT